MPDVVIDSADRELDLDANMRQAVWQRVGAELEAYHDQVGSQRVAPRLDARELRKLLDGVDFDRPVAAAEALEFAIRGLWEHQVHTPHPRYFGLFNPAPTSMGIAGDALAAAFNPQIAAWSHSPFGAEVERRLVMELGQRFGYAAPDLDGVFASGGAEANHTALLCALTSASPEYARGGTRGLRQAPAVYVSEQSHDSVFKAARLCGLGTDCVRKLAVGEDLRLEPERLAAAMEQDRRSGMRPLLVVATAGSTSTGAVDPVAELGEMAARAGAWFHVDAAWGGLAAMVPEMRGLLRGIEAADSITFDAHKSLSVPMGAGMFLTRHADILSRTFRVSAGYMPRDAAGMDEEVVDPFGHSMQWSRRFIGLKLFLSLAVAGWEGYAAALRHQVAMGDLLREEARADGWRVVNATALPLVCLADAAPGGDAPDFLEAVAQAVVASGEAWISAVRLPQGRAALRACVTNYRTGPEDVRALVATLGRARAACQS